MINYIMELITRQEAKQRGLTSYFTGTTCKRGHISPRNVNSCNCHECWREDSLQQRTDDPTKFKDKKQQEYLRNKSTILSQQSAYRKRNWTSIMDKRRNSPSHQAYMKSYLATYYRERWNNDPTFRANALANCRRRQARLQQALPMWAEVGEIKALYQRARQLTDSTGIPHVVDHIIPLNGKSVCGLHCLTNLRIITSTENRAKWNYLDESLL